MSWRSLAFALLGLTASCSSYATHAEMLKSLTSSDAIERRNAADGLRKEGAHRQDTEEALLEAVSHEYNSLALGAELIALGASGSPEAGEPICHYLHSHDPDIQRWARKAFYLWLPANADTRCPSQ